MKSESMVAPSAPALRQISESNDRTSKLLARYRRIRAFSENLCSTLEPEDCVVQSMPDVSPTNWHLAHTSWFF